MKNYKRDGDCDSMEDATVVLVCSNLHVGGGVQVATSCLTEMAGSATVASHVRVVSSSEVDANLKALGTNTSRFRQYSVEDVYGLRMLLERHIGKRGTRSVVFIVFGPLYKLNRRLVKVVGFAQPWVAYPENEVYAQLGALRRWKLRTKFAVQAWFYKRADHLIVEAPHVKRRLRAMGWKNRIDVVPNCVSAVYREPTRWQPIDIPAAVPEQLRIGIVSRDYVHKNLVVLPTVKRLLQDRHGLNVMFIVTFTEAEWVARGGWFRAAVTNVGPLEVAQCPTFYRQLDAVVFPSLLECFSATPLEALYMGVPLFASDRPFVRDVCGDAAHYFEPTEPESIASAIAEYFSRPADERKADPAVSIDPDYFDPALRARRYMKILRQYAPGLPDA